MRNHSNSCESHPDEARLVLALDGELDTAEAAGIAKHLDWCAACRGHWEQLRLVSEQIVEYHDRLASAPVFGRVIRKTNAGRNACATAAVAAALAALAWLFARPDRPPAQHHEVVAATVPEKAAVAPAPPQKRPRHRRAALVAQHTPSFIALPFSDRALPLEDATVVRVQLPIEELRLTGLAIDGDRTGVLVQADVLMGIDGLPRAIRLVQ